MNSINLLSHAELLTQYKAVQEKRFLADEELKEQLESMNTDEMKSKQQECKQAQAQLSVIEKKLGNVHFNCIYLCMTMRHNYGIA